MLDIKDGFWKDVKLVGVYLLSCGVVCLNSTTIWWSTADPLMNGLTTRLNVSSDVALHANCFRQADASRSFFLYSFLVFLCFITGWIREVLCNSSYCCLHNFQADLRLADFRAKQRAMEDALMALEVNHMYYCICFFA